MFNLIAQFRPMLRLRWLQLSALTLFLAGVGLISFQLKLCVLDVDLWWHLKVGDWIIQHVAVPHTGILSRTAADRPWVAYSWGYEVLLSRAYAWFGLIGIGVFGTILTIGVAYSVYWMLRRLSGNFWLSLIGGGVVCSAFLFNGMPRPFFFSIILYAITVALLREFNRAGKIETLYWLPPVFMLWANLHIQFIYGLFVVGLYAGINVVQRIANGMGALPPFVAYNDQPRRYTAKLVLIFAACTAATLIGPNFYHPYVSVFEYSRAKFPYKVILELQPLSFRGYSHFAELFVAAAGFYAIGFRRKLDLFKLALVAVASVVAFRTMRDAWFICLSAGACVADWQSSPETETIPSTSQKITFDPPETWLEKAGIAVVLAILLAAFSNGADFNARALDRAISADYPVNAINFLRRNPVRGPLYNNLNWGGFLMWYMPEYPVAVDGRNDLYGDELDKLFYQSQNADNSYTTDPYLNEAGIVLLDSELPLAKILTADPRFELVYHDQIATVYARR